MLALPLTGGIFCTAPLANNALDIATALTEFIRGTVFFASPKIEIVIRSREIELG